MKPRKINPECLFEKKVSRPKGVAPIWTKGLSQEFEIAYVVVMEQLWRAFRQDLEEPNLPIPFSVIAQIRALCCLLRVHPLYPRHTRFGPSHVKEWRTAVLKNLENIKKTIPEKYRDEFIDSVVADLDFLDEFMKRKPDPKKDLY